jgi:hypothetical protein
MVDRLASECSEPLSPPPPDSALGSLPLPRAAFAASSRSAQQQRRAHPRPDGVPVDDTGEDAVAAAVMRATADPLPLGPGDWQGLGEDGEPLLLPVIDGIGHATKFVRSISLDYDPGSASGELDASGHIANPSPLSRSNFRKRRLTYARPDVRPLGTSEATGEKTVFSAGEIGDTKTRDRSPFPPDLVGVYSCHGIEPAYDEVRPG